jgi:hypothetical protein
VFGMAQSMGISARAAFIAVLLVTAVTFISTTARAEIVTLQCSGDVAGKFSFDLSAGTGASYEDNRSTGLNQVEISSDTILFSTDPGETDQLGSSSRFRIDRQTDKIDQETYQYIDNKMVGSSHAAGQCKQVPNS